MRSYAKVKPQKASGSKKGKTTLAVGIVFAMLVTVAALGLLRPVLTPFFLKIQSAKQLGLLFMNHHHPTMKASTE